MIAEEMFATRNKSDGSIFFIILALSFALLFATLSYLSKIEALPANVQEKITTLKTSFLLHQEKKEPIKPVQKPIDLGEKPKVVKVEDLPKEISEIPPEIREEKKVYGLQKLYSTGLGSGGAMSDAVVGKFGNTINKDFDTVTATKADVLAKEITAAAAITQSPAFKKRVKPEITDEIRKSGVTGTVKVKVLVDIDGKVKKAVAQNDLGFGTMQAAIDACLQMEFTPALRGDEHVAVWITIPIRFERL